MLKGNNANAQRQLVLSNAAPSTLADLARVTVESPNWFFNSHEDPTKALLLFAYNSGHSFLPYVKDGVLPHSTECPAIMSETWTSDDNVPQDVRKLHAGHFRLDAALRWPGADVAGWTPFVQRARMCLPLGSMRTLPT